tara:strand:+ start:874 stop:2055 length:1182 start_codon:yes stop_codon:yes gene_type:complete
MNLDYEAFRARLPSDLLPHCDPSRPGPQRLLAARGLLPLGTTGQLSVLVALMGDNDAPVREAAERTLNDMPAPMLLPVIRNPATPDWLLEGLGSAVADRADLLAELLSNRKTPASVHIWVSGAHSAQVVHERLCNDLERLQKHPEIVEGLWQNPNVDRYILRPPIEFLVRQGIVIESIPLSREIFNNLSAKELEEVVAEVEMPAEIDAFLEVQPEPETEEGEDESEEAAEAEPEEPDDPNIEYKLIYDDEGNVIGREEKRKNLLQLIREMTPSQKIALALKGNKEARGYLIEDSNKLVATATIKSPRITLPEVVKAAGSRSVHSEVLRVICGNREWMKQYKIRVAVVNNPRTPIGRSMPLLKTMKQRDLKALMRNTGVPSGLRGAAKRMLRSG